MTKPPRASSPVPSMSMLDGAGAFATVIKLELQGLTATRFPLESVRKAMKIVPIGRPPGSVTDCPSVTDPVQPPTAKYDALKLPAVMPVANCSWLTVLAKLGNTCVGLMPSTAHRFEPLVKFPPVPAFGVSTAMYRVSLLFAVQTPNAEIGRAHV